MKFVPRSALFGRNVTDEEARAQMAVPSRAMQARSMPQAVGQQLRAGPGASVQAHAMPHAHQVELLKGEVVRLRQDRARIVKEANAKLGALAAEVQRLRTGVRVAYGPGVQVPGQGQVDVAVPTHALRNPYLSTVDGSRGAPPAQSDHVHAGAPADAAHAHPGDRAMSTEETVRAAEDAIFYGSGDAAFYEGGEND